MYQRNERNYDSWPELSESGIFWGGFLFKDLIQCTIMLICMGVYAVYQYVWLCSFMANIIWKEYYLHIFILWLSLVFYYENVTIAFIVYACYVISAVGKDRVL